jgi:hypothetical protein
VGSSNEFLRLAFLQNSKLEYNGALFEQQRYGVYDYMQHNPLFDLSMYVDQNPLDDVEMTQAVQIMDEMIVTDMASNDNFAVIQNAAAANKGRRTRRS